MIESKKRILLAAPYGKDTGGIARWTEHILSYYQQYGKGVELDLLPTGRKDVGKLLQNKFLRISKGVLAYWDILKKESQMMSGKQYDVFHLTSSASFGLFKDYLMLKKARSKGAKTIVHFRFGRIPDLYLKQNWEWRMIKKVIRLCDTVIVLDEKSYSTLHNSAGFEHISKLANPVSPRVLEAIEKCGDIRRESGKLLFVGHGYWTKGIKELVLACSQIPNIRLTMLGEIEDNIKNELAALIRHASWLDIRGNASYDKVIKEMMTCNVFVLPTYTEGFPNVILESMACGCPIVTTDVGAIPEMLDIDNGSNYGICVKPMDVDGLCEAIKRMLDDKDYSRRCGENAKKRVNELYSMPIIWKELLNIWNQI